MSEQTERQQQVMASLHRKSQVAMEQANEANGYLGRTPTSYASPAMRRFYQAARSGDFHEVMRLTWLGTRGLE